MKHLKTYEGFRDIYKINPDKPVVIEDKYLSKIDSIDKSYKGKPGKMEYHNDEFFCYLIFDDKTITIPTYMLIHQDEYEINKSANKYNL